MATTKRMFSNDIVGSDSFLEMPSTSQALYFHLGMRCDDDGFVNPNVTMRMIGANKNDLDILIGKRFLLLFANGVVVIKHHRINNKWDSRDSRRTLYTEELKKLFLKENNSYTFDSEQGIPVDEKYITNKSFFIPDGNPTGSRRQNRIEENRIEENNKHTTRKEIIKNKYGEFNRVLLSDEEYKKLSERFGEKNTKIMIKKLDSYIESKGKKYKSHYATILNWFDMEIEKHQQKLKDKKGTVAFS